MIFDNVRRDRVQLFWSIFLSPKMRQWYQPTIIALLWLRRSSTQPQRNQRTIISLFWLRKSKTRPQRNQPAVNSLFWHQKLQQWLWQRARSTTDSFREANRKRRQRTTFSPNEVWELELAFKRRPYLISEDAEELVQKLGIPVKSVKVS